MLKGQSSLVDQKTDGVKCYSLEKIGEICQFNDEFRENETRCNKPDTLIN